MLAIPDQLGLIRWHRLPGGELLSPRAVMDPIARVLTYIQSYAVPHSSAWIRVVIQRICYPTIVFLDRFAEKTGTLAMILRQAAKAWREICGHPLRDRLQLERMLVTTAWQVSHFTLAGSALIHVEFVRCEEGILST